MRQRREEKRCEVIDSCPIPFQLKSAANQLESVKPAGDLKQHQKLVHWWRTIIYRHSRTSTGEDQLLKRINLDLRSNNFKTYEHNE